MSELMKDIKRISELTNGEAVLVGGVCSMLNDKTYEKPINDIDIIVNINYIDKLKEFGEIRKLKSNLIYGLDVKRFYINRESLSIDIFVQEIDLTTETLVDGVKLKHLTTEGQRIGLSKIIDNISKINKQTLLETYKEKLNKICA